MPDLTLAQPVEGGVPGDVVFVPDERADWYKAHGYAYDPADTTSKLLNTSPPRANDPTLAENREHRNSPLEPPVGAPEPDPVEGQSVQSTASSTKTAKKSSK